MAPRGCRGRVPNPEGLGGHVAGWGCHGEGGRPAGCHAVWPCGSHGGAQRGDTRPSLPAPRHSKYYKYINDVWQPHVHWWHSGKSPPHVPWWLPYHSAPRAVGNKPGRGGCAVDLPVVPPTWPTWFVTQCMLNVLIIEFSIRPSRHWKKCATLHPTTQHAWGKGPLPMKMTPPLENFSISERM